jgi:DNA-binding Lrp family transcriptional regulator
MATARGSCRAGSANRVVSGATASQPANGGHSQESSVRIEQALLAIPAVVACYLVSGSSDFLVEAVVPDLAGYEQLLLGQILAIPSIVEAQSTFAIRTILSRGPLPLDHWHPAHPRLTATPGDELIRLR